MGKTHLVVSTGVTLSVLGMMGHEITLPVMAVAAASALLPDIDEPNAALVSRTLPTPVVMTFKLMLILLAIFIYFKGSAHAPWHIAVAVLIAAAALLPGRTIRKIIMLLIGAVCLAIGAPWQPWSYIIGCLLVLSALATHRGLTHSLYAPIAWAALLYWSTSSIHPSLWLAGGISYFIHLIPCDVVTVQGIRPLPPLKWKWRLKWMSTGSWSGSIVENATILLTIVFVWYVFFRSDSSAVMSFN